jgi:hypothetical protein
MFKQLITEKPQPITEKRQIMSSMSDILKLSYSDGDTNNVLHLCTFKTPIFSSNF